MQFSTTSENTEDLFIFNYIILTSFSSAQFTLELRAHTTFKVALRTFLLLLIIPILVLLKFILRLARDETLVAAAY